MTGYTVHTGSNDKFRKGWDNIFKSKPKAKTKTSESKSPGKAAGKQTGKTKSR